MIISYTVNWDGSHRDYEETFPTLREAMKKYNSLENVPYKDLTYDDTKRGTLTLLTSDGIDNLRNHGFLPCDYD